MARCNTRNDDDKYDDSDDHGDGCGFIICKMMNKE